jgi:hypothetical protein
MSIYFMLFAFFFSFKYAKYANNISVYILCYVFVVLLTTQNIPNVNIGQCKGREVLPTVNVHT